MFAGEPYQYLKGGITEKFVTCDEQLVIEIIFGFGQLDIELFPA